VAGAEGERHATTLEAVADYDPENLFHLNQNIEPAR
jgi:hypothetical protein